MNSVSLDKKYPLACTLLLSVALLLTLLQASLIKAQLLSFEPEDKSAAFNEYLVQAQDRPGQIQLLFEGTPGLYADNSAPGAYAALGEREASPTHSAKSLNFGYLVEQAPERRDETTADVDKLLEIVKQINQEQQESQANQLLTSEIQMDGTISPPVNDPREFEVAEDLANSAMKLKLAQTANRSAAINQLLPIDIDSILDELRGQVDGLNQQQLNTDPSLLSELDSKRESSTSASRYGGGEYIDHPLALIGHQYMQGGAGEGRQLLGPDGTFENVQVVKSDHAVPSYCNPPNPCPIGFTAEDGCLEQFVNSASFSREYQAKQQCSCDNEHSLFNCASPSTTSENDVYSQQSNEIAGSAGGPRAVIGNDDEDDISNSILKQQTSRQTSNPDDRLLNTLARTIQNRFGALSSVRNLIMSHEEGRESNDAI